MQAASEGIKVAFEVQKGVHHSAPKSTQNPRGTIGGILFFTLGKCRFHAGCNGIFESLSCQQPLLGAFFTSFMGDPGSSFNLKFDPTS